MGNLWLSLKFQNPSEKQEDKCPSHRVDVKINEVMCLQWWEFRRMSYRPQWLPLKYIHFYALHQREFAYNGIHRKWFTSLSILWVTMLRLSEHNQGRPYPMTISNNARLGYYQVILKEENKNQPKKYNTLLLITVGDIS